MKNFYTTSLKNVMILAIGLIAFFTHSNLDAQLTVEISTNASSFCNTSCDTLDLSGQVYFNGNPEDASSVQWSWTGPNGFASTLPTPRVPITSLANDGEYCVTITTVGVGSASDCEDIEVIETIEWTCPEKITVTGVDCTTDLVDYNFTVSDINCGVSSDFELILYNGATNGIIYQQTWTGAPGTYYFGPAADPMDYPMATSVIENLPFGTHELINTIYNDSDPSKVYAQCITEVKVVESINNVACNDHINITLTNDCEAVITPDMILQGTYCYENFVMSIEDVGINQSQLLLTEPGEYVVSVTGLSGISCWGRILAEDKSTPILDCQDIEVYCSEYDFLGQGAVIHGFGSAELDDMVVGTNDSEEFNLNISGVTGLATNIVLRFDAQMPNVSDIEIYLTPPSGNNTIELINATDFDFMCQNSNINVCLFDEAENDYSVFASPEYCRPTLNAWIGEVRPSQAFSNLYSAFAGPALGNWKLEVVNKSNSTPIQINYVQLRVQTNEGFIMDSDDVIINSGCSDPEFDAPVDVTIGVDCEDGYWNIIERTWTVRNPISGLSATCSHTISLLRWSTDDIIWPKDHNNLQLPSIYCRDLFRPNGNLDGTKVNTSDTIPLPAFTGSPRVPFGELCGNFQVTYNDLRFRICGKFAVKIIRRWSVLDWCTGEIVEHDQIIKIEDNEPIDMVREDYVNVNPSGYANADAYIIFTDYFDCSGDWDIVPPVILDPGCDPDYTLRVYYLVDDDEDPSVPPVDGEYIDDNVVYQNGFPVEITALPSGRRTWIKYEVSDDCGNTGVAFAEVDVIDDDKPSPVCIEYTVVALNNEGCAKLHAESLDNGSWDNCGIESFGIRKEIGTSIFTEYIKFCCEQGCPLENKFVHLLVTDINGNTNTCRVEVEIQDNIDPILTERPQAVYNFDCDQTANVGAIIDNALNTFAYEDNCDPNQDGIFDIKVSWTRSDGGAKNDPIMPGNCGISTLVIFYTLLDECNNPLPNGQSQFNQSIFINNNNTSFDVNEPQDPPTFTECFSTLDLHPDNMAPQYVVDFDDVSTSQCTNLAITWDDLVFENVDNACLKILRTWTVIDWCIADQYGIAQATWTHIQTIKVNDTQGPTFDAPSNISWDATTADCRVNVTDTLLRIDVFDTCTDMFINQEIYVEYRIFYADGTQSNLIRNDLDATGLYPYGTNRIEWSAEDHCGNISTWTTFVTVNDVKAPTPYCLGSAVTATMVEDQPVGIWAIDYDLGGFDNVTGNTSCQNFNSLKIYFIDTINGVPTEVQGLEFDCDDVPDGIEQMIELNVYYEDEAGNVDFCTVILILQDNVNDVCEDVAGSRIAGSVHTEETEPLANVKVELTSNVSDLNALTYTDGNGDYAFPSKPVGNNYYLSAEKTDNPLNGVSTLDLVIIQKHILGISTLPTPFKLMAADADNTGNVSATDLITIRKLILGLISEFPNNQKSWRFPETNQSFVDVNQPFPYNETISMFNMGASGMENQDFMAVKVGDVNGTAIANSITGPTDDDNNNIITLEINEEVFSKGNTVTVPVYAADLDEMIGFQNTFNFNTNALEYVGIEGGELDMTEDNVGQQDAQNGVLTLSWNDTESVKLDSETVLFELQFTAKKNATLSDNVFLSSDVTKAEAYTNELEIMNMRLNVRNAENTEFVLYQNTPNPFAESTDIRFSIPSDSEITFRVYDLNGKEIMTQTKDYNQGTHTISLHRDELNVSGIMYYTIETAFGLETRKMIQIK